MHLRARRTPWPRTQRTLLLKRVNSRLLNSYSRSFPRPSVDIVLSSHCSPVQVIHPRTLLVTTGPLQNEGLWRIHPSPTSFSTSPSLGAEVQSTNQPIAGYHWRTKCTVSTAMSQWSQSSLTPSRPAPAPPGARQSPASQLSSTRSGQRSQAAPAYSSKSLPNPYPLQRNASSPSNDVVNAIVRTGIASVKEEGIRSFLWSKKWLVLTVNELQIYKNEVCHHDDAR